ncbi:MAG: M23 family metallopeptidase [Oscillospiraceae bacterium]|jgi:murein DD-endopeptidase MepM/ murein hydrolase activator NlpD|nr:M23 family metallopeptidase [Oscillospiraceae bacterium]
MPPKGTEGAGYPSRQQHNSQSEQDFNDIYSLRLDSLYGLDVDDGDFWAFPTGAVPVAPQSVSVPEVSQKSETPQASPSEDVASFRLQTIAPLVFGYLADFGNTIFGGLKIALRRLLFIPRLLGAVFSWAFRGLRAFADKTIAEQKKHSISERGVLQRELKGIRPYLKKAKGDPANWFRRVGVVTRKLTENHRASIGRMLNVALPAAGALLLFAVISHWSNQTFALKVDYHHQTVGYIRSEAVFAEAQKLAEQRIIRTDGNDSSLDMPVYSLARVPVNSLYDSLALSDKLVEESGENLTNAVGIFIDKKFLCSIKNRSDAENVFDKILAPYRTNETGSYVDFVEDIRYEEGYYPDDSKTMWDASRLAEKLNEPKQSKRTYTIKAGDDLWTLALANGLTYQELLNLNPKYKDGATYYEGDKITLSANVNYVQVKQMKTETRTVEIPFETITTTDPSLIKGVKRTVSEGTSGKEKVTEMVTYVDGHRTSVKEVNRERLSEPVSARVSVGSKVFYSNPGNTNSNAAVNITVSNSGFVWPAPSCRSISSSFGWRFGGRSYHQGIDLIRYGAPTAGTLAVSALDGTVEFSGWRSDYGNRIIINHGGGVKTTYSHLSSRTVYAGQHVMAGQPIGRLGNTGYYSYGAHLHFEILINGSFVNPINYLR